MTPSDLLPPTAPGDELRPAAALLHAAGVDGLPVITDGQLVGVLTRRGIGRLVHERSVQARSRP